jgi:hypothetical protein
MIKKLLFAMLALLLLSGCRQGGSKADGKPAVKHAETTEDSTGNDSIKAINEQMRHWDVLHGGMRQRESDK